MCVAEGTQAASGPISSVEGLHRILESFTESYELPIYHKVDVFGESLDQAIDFGKGDSAFEDKGLLEGGLDEEQVENEAHPEVLFGDRWPDSQLGSSFGKKVGSVLWGAARDFIHAACL